MCHAREFNPLSTVYIATSVLIDVDAKERVEDLGDGHLEESGEQ